MSDLKVEQLQSFFKSVGLEDSDFDKISKEDIEDFTPYVEKAKSGIREVLMADTTFLDEISRPYKDAPIGKEKQLKKEVRKFFNLQIKEDDLAKMPLSEILAQGTEHLKSTTTTDIDKLKNDYSLLLEENERLKNEEIPNKISEIENTWKQKIQSKDIFEELMGEVAKETQVQKENISMFATTFQGYLSQSGFKLDIDSKRALKIKDAEGLPAKNKDGGILHLKEALRDFSTKMQVNVKPVGGASGTTQTGGSSKYKELLNNSFGKGFAKA